MTIPFFDDKAVRALLDHDAVAEVLDAAFTDLARGASGISPRARADCGAVKLSAMGGVWHARSVAGLKVYPTVDGRFDFLVNLFDLAPLRPAAILQGGELTRLRTGAIVGLVASKCVAKPSVRVALFGAGVQGRSILAALSSRFRIEGVAVVDPALDASGLAGLAAETGLACRLAAADAAVEGADVVVTATRSKSPVFDGTRLKRGCFVAAVGTSLPNGRELDDATLAAARPLIVEWKGQSLTEAGEIVLGKVSGAVAEERIVDFADLYGARAAWRSAPDDIVVFKSVGVGLADVATAWLVRERAGRAGRPGTPGETA